MSAVSRSVYQKVCEENKRLKKEIEVLVMEPLDSKLLIRIVKKWTILFTKQRQFEKDMKELARMYIVQHPEIKIPKP